MLKPYLICTICNVPSLLFHGHFIMPIVIQAYTSSFSRRSYVLESDKTHIWYCRGWFNFSSVCYYICLCMLPPCLSLLLGEQKNLMYVSDYFTSMLCHFICITWVSRDYRKLCSFDGLYTCPNRPKWWCQGVTLLFQLSRKIFKSIPKNHVMLCDFICIT